MCIKAALLLMVLLTQSGCLAMTLDCAGINLTSIPTKDDVHAFFGSPQLSGVTVLEEDDGKKYAFDEYLIHRKISHTSYSFYGIAVMWTLGTCELVNIPIEVLRTSQNLIMGRRVRFLYAEDGSVARILENGEGYLWYEHSLPTFARDWNLLTELKR